MTWISAGTRAHPVPWGIFKLLSVPACNLFKSLPQAGQGAHISPFLDRTPSAAVNGVMVGSCCLASGQELDPTMGWGASLVFWLQGKFGGLNQPFFGEVVVGLHT